MRCVIQPNFIETLLETDASKGLPLGELNQAKRGANVPLAMQESGTVHELRKCKECRSFGIPNQCAISNAAQ
jgi:hypothetical protein